MRAKEYITQNQSSIKYLDDIKRVINELMPLRKDKAATDDYYNKILSADIHRQNYLLQKDYFERNNAMQPQEPTLETFNNEIFFERVAEVREILFDAIKQDKSFGYLYFLLGTEQNTKHKSEPIDCIPNAESIHEAINCYRDDYPKSSLDDYLDDEFNYKHYDFLVRNNIFPDRTKAFLDYFNKVYQIYDDIRCQKNKVLQIRQYCQHISFVDEKEKYWLFSFICQLISTFEKDDAQLARCKCEIEKMLAPLQDKFGLVKNADSFSNCIFLNKSRGIKVNFIRVINCLFELGFFKDENQNSITKKEVFALFGQLVNMDLSTYQNDLSVSKSTANRDMKSSLKIFEEMIEKQKDINTQ